MLWHFSNSNNPLSPLPRLQLILSIYLILIIFTKLFSSVHTAAYHTVKRYTVPEVAYHTVKRYTVPEVAYHTGKRYTAQGKVRQSGGGKVRQSGGGKVRVYNDLVDDTYRDDENPLLSYHLLYLEVSISRN
jgi:hypothetical protein